VVAISGTQTKYGRHPTWNITICEKSIFRKRGQNKNKDPVIQTSSKLPFHHGIWLCHLSEIDQNLMLAQRSNGITQIINKRLLATR
jgi:hypothetical protein